MGNKEFDSVKLMRGIRLKLSKIYRNMESEDKELMGIRRKKPRFYPEVYLRLVTPLYVNNFIIKLNLLFLEF